MTPLLLIGGGGHCRSVIDVIETGNKFVIRGIVQPNAESQASVYGYPVLGDDGDLPVLLADTPNAIVTVGQIKTPSIRRRLFEILVSHGANIPVLVSPYAYLSSHANLSSGCVVMHGAIVNAGSQVGLNNIINTFALLEHDVQVGNHCHVATGARVNGEVIIEDGCFIGSGAILKQGIRIGCGSVIGAGAIISRNVPPNSLIKSTS